MGKLAAEFGLLEPLRQRVAEGMPAYGSCAGMIMLSDRLIDGRSDQETIGGIDMTVRRNAFGRQNESFEAAVEVAGVGPVVYSEKANWAATLLASCPPNARRDLYLITAEPGTARESDPHMPGVVEHVVMSTGRANVGLLNEPVEVGPGDYVAYPGDLPHIFEALEPGTVAVMVSEHR